MSQTFCTFISFQYSPPPSHTMRKHCLEQCYMFHNKGTTSNTPFSDKSYAILNIFAIAKISQC